MNKNPWLILLDLDGTTLSNDGVRIPEYNKKVIAKLTELGHYVCICSGRPPRATRRIYVELGLETMQASNNGGILTFPKNQNFLPINVGIRKTIVEKIINDKAVKKYVKCILIEKDNIPYLNQLSDTLYEEFHVSAAEQVILGDLNKNVIDKSEDGDRTNITCMLIETHELWDFQSVNNLLNKLSESNEISYRMWPKPTKKSIVIDITHKFATKAEAGKILASYYKVDKDNIIAFGDGNNDYEMIKWATHGIKMKNGSHTLDKICNDVTKYTNDESGVGHYLNKFFDLKIS